MCYLSLLHRHNNAEHLPIEESDESDYGEDEPLDDQEIDLGIGIHRIKKEEEVDLLTSDRPVLVYQRQLMDLATTHVNSNCTFKDCGEAISMSTEIIASAIYIKWVSMLYLLKFCFLFVFIPPFLFYHCPSACPIKVITKLPNSEQSYKGKVKTHNYINRQNQSTTGKL